MKKLTFKDKFEFACAIKGYGKLWDVNGRCVFYDESYMNPFRTTLSTPDRSSSINSTWDQFNFRWETTEPLKHLDLVYAWDSVDTHSRVLGIYNIYCNSIFRSDGDSGRNWDNYEKYTGETPQWYLDAIKKLKTTNSK